MNCLPPTEIMAGPPQQQGSAFRRIGSGVDAWINRHSWSSFTIFSLFYFVIAISLSSLKLLWFDELITVHVARLGSLAAIWHALAQGVDPNPPLIYILVHASSSIFGNHEFAYRLPAMIGYWIGLLSLFAYLRRMLPAVWALAGAVLSTTMGGFQYSYESRSYGLYYGMAMLAFFCWSQTTDSRRSLAARRFALIGMVFALAAGISSNYFAVLAFLPIAAGEAVRTFLRYRAGSTGQAPRHTARRSLFNAIDLSIWIAMLAAASPLNFYRRLIEHNIGQFGAYTYYKVSLARLGQAYTAMVGLQMLCLILGLFVFVAVYIVARYSLRCCTTCRASLLPRWIDRITSRPWHDLPIPMHEAAVVFTLMAYPIIGYTAASIHGGMLATRYVIPVCFGFAIAVTLLCFQLFAQVRRAGLAMLCFGFAWFICCVSIAGCKLEVHRLHFYRFLNQMTHAEASAPQGTLIAVADPLLALGLEQYAPASLVARIVFPVDFPAIRFFRHDDSGEENLWAGRNLIYSLPIIPLADFHNNAGKYLVLAGDGNWMVNDLAYHRYPIQRLPIKLTGHLGAMSMTLSPALYIAYGGNAPAAEYAPLTTPVPFEAADNLPQATKLPAIPGALQ